MNQTTRRTALALFAFGLSALGALAQEAGGAKDLTVEANPPPRRRRRRTAARRPLRDMQASLMSIGPSTIQIGQPMRFRMVSLSDGFGSLYSLSASGRTQLWFENLPLRGGRPLVFPRAGLTVRAAPPAGDETLLFLATRRPMAGFVGAGSTSTTLDLQLDHAGFREALRQKLLASARGDWAVAEIQIRVVG